MESLKRVFCIIMIFILSNLVACNDNSAEKTVVSSGIPKKVESSKEDLKDRCVKSAIDNGYISAKCAHNFIKACITTGKKSEMREVLNLDNQLGLIKTPDCPNMPSTYVRDFKRIFDENDKF